MKIQTARFFLVLQFISLFLIASCQGDDSNEVTPDPELENAQLKSFPLSETSHLNIKIVHPEIVNGEEKKYGEIEITIPASHQSLMLSLKQFDLDNNKYSISPSIGDQQDFSKGAVIYTISSNFHEDKSVHYNVKVVIEAAPVNTNSKITGFSFEKSKNPSLESTINAVKIVEYENYSENAIYILVPVGTDFSKLTPTITFDAAKLYYSLGPEFKPYTSNTMVVDFKYPKHFYLQAENSNGNKSKVYNVIVDVKDPIKFEQLPVITQNVKAGDGSTTQYFAAVAKWTNQGNHPIKGMAVESYKNKTFPFVYTGDANTITAILSNPVVGIDGVLPGEKGDVNITVKRMSITGKYTTTAEFAPTFNFNNYTIHNWPVTDRVEGIFNTAELKVESTISE
ncbi:hypothetical protein [Flavobacterium limi]|uniref:DUF1735 domain-containing protein n=1 Tax=Flavobacterium limi TaxID=2045105 RepID=A0ABQ1TUV5_9FLAO|nr:hypothetical protein [Flavobacterium limi]GGF03640.1 hypothetical protein GCM10011518_10960 [Flavobacterium limi]